MHKLAIIIPTHNEEKRIGGKLKSYISYFKKNKDIDIIVVLNACSDGTKEVVKKYKQKNLEILEFVKGGKGFAVIEGFKHALKKNYNYIGFVDADMSTTAEEFNRLLTGIGSYDGVIASRYIPGSKLTPRNTLSRVIASRIYNAFIRSILLIPFRDTQCGAKIFRADALKKVIDKIGMTSWAFDIELLYLFCKNEFKIKEIPTVWSNQEYSTINFWKSGPWMALAVVRLRLLNSPFRKMIRVYDKFIGFFKPSK